MNAHACIAQDSPCVIGANEASPVCRPAQLLLFTLYQLLRELLRMGKELVATLGQQSSEYTELLRPQAHLQQFRAAQKGKNSGSCCDTEALINYGLYNPSLPREGLETEVHARDFPWLCIGWRDLFPKPFEFVLLPAK